MNRTEFIKKLEKHLKSLPEDEIKNAVDYYNEYLDEAGSENEDEVIKKLPTPQQIAIKLLAEFNIKEIESKKKENKNLPILTIILAVLSSPITIPFGIVFIVMIFVLFLLIGCCLMVAILLCFSLILSCVLSFVCIIPAMSASLSTGIFVLGYFLCSLALCVLFVYYTIVLIKKSYIGLKSMISKLIVRRYSK